MTATRKRAVPKARTDALALTGQRQLRVLRQPGRDTLELIDASGSACLTILIEEHGVTIAATGAKLAFRTDAELELDAEHLTLRGRRGIQLESQGEISSRARRQGLIATHGSVQIEANDDVKLDGERILLNTVP